MLYPQQSVFTIVHELGHAYNLRHVGAGRYAMVLLDPEMRSFLAATGWQILSSDDEIRSGRGPHARELQLQRQLPLASHVQ